MRHIKQGLQWSSSSNSGTDTGDLTRSAPHAVVVCNEQHFHMGGPDNSTAEVM